jgi:hypothetical protein
MPRPFTILCFAASVYFVACKKSSDSDSALITGKWTPIHEVYFFYSFTGLYMDSISTLVNAQDYFEFENGVLHRYENDASSDGAIYSTFPYHIYNNQYLIAGGIGGSDTAKIRFSDDNDTLTLTDIDYDSPGPSSGNESNEYDTTIMIRRKQ